MATDWTSTRLRHATLKRCTSKYKARSCKHRWSIPARLLALNHGKPSHVAYATAFAERCWVVSLYSSSVVLLWLELEAALLASPQAPRSSWNSHTSLQKICQSFRRRGDHGAAEPRWNETFQITCAMSLAVLIVSLTRPKRPMATSSSSSSTGIHMPLSVLRMPSIV